MTTTTTDLTALGDRLQAACAADLAGTDPSTLTAARVSRWRRKAVAVPAAVALGGLGIGAAAAAGLFTSETVASSMTTSNLLFGGATATCTTSDNVVFDCRLASPPPGEGTPDAGAAQAAGKPVPAVPADYTAYALPFFVADKVAGGCRGVDAAGLRWTCYAGQAAVDQQIIGQDFLGQAVPPGTRSRG